jgi:predicted nucleic acid-binding protein
MILDTSYFMPLAKVEITTDLLLALAENKIQPDRLSFDLVTLNSISLFELQAKAAKLGINNESVIEALTAISKRFKIEPYNSPEIIESASLLRQNFFTDYIDCIIIATAIVRREELVTEDSKILRKRKDLSDKYSLGILSYRDIVKAVP